MTESNRASSSKLARDNFLFYVALLVGPACCWSWLIITYLSAGLGISPTNLSLSYDMLFIFVSLALFAGVQFLNLQKSIASWTMRIRTSGASIAFLFIVVVGSPLAGTAAQIPFEVKIITWGLHGIATGILFLYWRVAWSMLRNRTHEKLELLFAGCLLLINFLSFSVMYAPRIVQIFAAILFGSVSLAIHSSVFRKEDTSANPLSGIPVSNYKRIDVHMPLRHAANLVIIGVYLGFSIGLALQINEQRTVFHLLLIAFSLANIVILFSVVVLKRTPTLTMVMRIVFPLLAASSLALPLLSLPLASKIMCFTAFAGCIVFFFAQLFFNINWNFKHHSLPTYGYAYGAMTWLGGLAGGWGIQTLLALIEGNNEAINIVICYILLATLVFATAFSPFGSEPSIKNVENHSSSSSNNVGIWSRTIQVVAENHRLSPKETEILGYLARGRNAAFIREKLIVSEHTVKTHIYHIYKKLAVSSQQDLISIVDKRLAKEKLQREND